MRRLVEIFAREHKKIASKNSEEYFQLLDNLRIIDIQLHKKEISAADALRKKLELFSGVLKSHLNVDEFNTRLNYITQNNWLTVILKIGGALAAWEYGLPGAATAGNAEDFIRGFLSKFMPDFITDTLANPTSLFLSAFLANFPIFVLNAGPSLGQTLGDTITKIWEKGPWEYLKELGKWGFAKGSTFGSLSLGFSLSMAGLAYLNPWEMSPTVMAVSVIPTAIAFAYMNISGAVTDIKNKAMKELFAKYLLNPENWRRAPINIPEKPMALLLINVKTEK